MVDEVFDCSNKPVEGIDIQFTRNLDDRDVADHPNRYRQVAYKSGVLTGITHHPDLLASTTLYVAQSDLKLIGLHEVRNQRISEIRSPTLICPLIRLTVTHPSPPRAPGGRALTAVEHA
ncbi:hypothetical protein SUDANB1_04992 [Streptomyces sp. enrichment culture]